MVQNELKHRFLDRVRKWQDSHPVHPTQGTVSEAALSHAQLRMWLADQLSPGGTDYIVTAAARLRGSLDISALEAAFTTLVARHHILRTRYTIGDDREPIQVVGSPWHVEAEIVDAVEAEDFEAAARRAALASAGRPFDLAAGRPLRVSVIRGPEDNSVLLVAFHHIAIDGHSLSVLARELPLLYEEAATGRPAALPEVQVQYADFAQGQHTEVDEEVSDRQLAYWKDRLSGMTPLELPTDRPRPKISSGEGAAVTFDIPPELAEGMRRMASANGCSLFMAGLAAFQAVLARWSRSDDLAVGCPIAVRNRADIADTVGFFVNTLVMRTDLSGHPTFRELLERVRDSALDAYANQELPFERLVEELAPDRGLDRHPLFQVMFELENGSGESDWTLPGLDASPFEIPKNTAKFDLSCTLAERDDGGLAGSLVFATALFDSATIERMAGHIISVIRSAVADPETRVGGLAILSAEERRQLLVDFNDTGRTHRGLAPVHRLFEEQAARTPDAVAVVFGDDALTYAELDGRANRTAHRLHERGVRRGTRVGVCLERSADLVAGLLGVLKAGGAYVPLDPAYPRERLRFMREDVGADVVLAHTATGERVPGDRKDTLFMDGVEDAYPPYDLGVPAGLDDFAYVIYTSGSTGTPKGVPNYHRGVANRLLWGQRTFRLSPADVVVQKTPYSFDVSVWELFWPLIAGARLIVAEPGGHRDSDYLSRLLAQHGVTTMHFVPSLLREFLDAVDLDRLPELRQVFCSGEALPTDVVHRFLDADPSRSLHNLYGPTEASIEVSHWECDGTESGYGAPIGRPIDNTELFVMDGHGELAPLGVPGELWIGGVGVASGYWNKPGLTSERFVRHPFAEAPDARAYRTGDLVRRLPSGVLEFLGRMDQQMKLRGLRIEPGEIESVLDRHGAVASSVVELREDRARDQRLVAYCVPTEGSVFNAAALRSWSQKSLPEYMVPASFVPLAALPLNQSGKVDRRALPEPEREHLALTKEYAPPTTERERLFAGIWADVLGFERVGVHDDFFELGGHSLLATKAAGRMAASTGSEVGVRDVFLRPTVASLAAGLGASRDGQERLLAPGERPNSSGVSFAQRRLWFLDQLAPGGHEYVIPHVLRVRGSLDLPALEAAFRKVLERHEVLRSRFVTGDDGEPVQIIDASSEFEIGRVDLGSGEPAGQDEDERARAAFSRVRQAVEAPFDLAADRLLRATAIRLSEQDHKLVVAMHHIVSDGWSTEILARELQAFYTAVLSGSPADISELTVQFGDYAEWQWHRMTGELLDRDLRYWRERLAGVPSLDLPTDYARPSERTGSGDRVGFVVPADTARKLHEVASGNGATLFMAALAAFDVLLSRYSGQDDVVVGSPIAARTRPELENLIGFFVNTIVLRTDTSGDPTFDELVVRVRDSALSAYEHQELPFERLVEEISPDRSISRNPLFNVSFAVQNYAAGRWELPGVSIENLDIGTSVAQFDLSLFLTELPGGNLDGELVFSTELFDVSTAELIVERFLRVLEQVTEDSGLRVGSVDLFTPGERGRILVDWNAIAAPGVDEGPLHRLMESQAARTPDAIAVVHGTDFLTYAELNARANRLARHLRGREVVTESLVGVFLERGPDLIVSVLAVLKSGGAYVPLDIDDPSDRLRTIVADTGPTLIIAESGTVHALPDTGVSAIVVDDPEFLRGLSGEESRDLPLHSGPANLAYVMYTSGSTGAPKGVMVEHRSVNSLVEGPDYGPITSDDVIAQAASFAFDAFTFECWAPLVRGASLVILPKDMVLSADELRGAITRHGISFLFLTSALFNQHVTDRPDLCDGMSTVIYGGEAVDRSAADALTDGPWSPDRLVQAYGPTEATVFTTFEVGNTTHRRRPRVPIGRPVANRRVFVVDLAGNPVPVGVPGELVVGGPGIARGYWNRPDLTAERFGWQGVDGGEGERTYRTGDLVKWLPDGQLEFLRRCDNQIKVRGHRIEPGEIEKVLVDDPAVASAVVVDREDASASKHLVAYCVPTPGQATDIMRLRGKCRQALPSHMVPSGYVELPALPMTSNGKIDRATLAARQGDRLERGRGHVAPRSDTERTLADIWETVLGVDAVGVHDNFFELGGHSLQMVRIVNRLRAAGFELTVRDLLQHQTIDALAKEERAPAKGVSLAVELAGGSREGTVRPIFCIHPGGGSARWYLPLARQLAGSFATVGIEAAGLDGSEIPMDRIHDIAARYWKEIDAVHGRGPHLLLGWSYGGTVAQEMSRQRPGDVEAVFLIEPPVLEAGVVERLRGFADGYREADRLWRSGQHASDAERREIGLRLVDIAAGLEVPHDNVSLDEWLPFEALGLLYDAAVQHRPEPSEAQTVLVVSDEVRAATDGSPYSYGDYSDYIAYWRSLCSREFRVVDVPETHMDMVSSDVPLSAVVREIMRFARNSRHA